MTGTLLRPVARGWEITGAGIDRPGAPERFCAAVLPELEHQAGYLGKIVLVNRRLRWLRGLSFWETQASSEPSWDTFTATARDVLGPDCEVGGPHPYEVLFSTFAAARPTGPDKLVVRVTAYEGGHVTTPPVVEVLTRHLTSSVVEAPGCGGALVLRELDQPSLIIVSSWVDDEAAARTARLAAELMRTIDASTESTSTSVGTYDVLVHHPFSRDLR